MKHLFVAASIPVVGIVVATILAVMFTFLQGSFKIFADSESSALITEFLANPVGADEDLEWIELYNPTSYELDLFGWSVSDVQGTTKSFELDGKTIQPHSTLILMRTETQIVLNNDKEQVKLRSPEGVESYSDLFSPVVEGKSFAFVFGSWEVTDPSPGSVSFGDSSPTPSAVPSPTPSSASTPSTSPTPSLSPSPTLSPSPSISPSPTPSAPSPSPSPSPNLSNIELSEFLACGGSTEWVELYNPNEQSVTLKGWKLFDSTSQYKSLDSMTIQPKGFGVKEWSGYYLNNDGDSIRLNIGDQEVESFTYDSCEDGSSWAKNGQTWGKTTSVTKGKQNQFTEMKIIDTNTSKEHVSESVQQEANSVVRKQPEAISASPSPDHTSLDRFTHVFDSSFSTPTLLYTFHGERSNTPKQKNDQKSYLRADKKKNNWGINLLVIFGGTLSVSSSLLEVNKWYNGS